MCNSKIMSKVSSIVIIYNIYFYVIIYFGLRLIMIIKEVFDEKSVFFENGSLQNFSKWCQLNFGRGGGGHHLEGSSFLIGGREIDL